MVPEQSLKDGDEGGEGVGDLEESEEYYWAANHDEARRAFIFNCMANADIDARILVKNMKLIEDWIKEGKLPDESAGPVQRNRRV